MATLATNKHTLLDLPNELIAQIIDCLDSDPWPHNRRHVRRFRRTCKKICELSERAFFRFLHVVDDIQEDQLQSMLKERPERFDLVKVFVVYPQDDSPLPWLWLQRKVQRASMPFFERVVRAIPKFHQLRTLHIYTKFQYDSQQQLFAALNLALGHADLAELRECTLYSDKWHPVWINPLLGAPNLTTLKVMNPFLDDTDNPLPPAHSTRLKHLTWFDDGSSNPDVISTVLSLPASLETLEIQSSHGHDYTRDLEYRCLTNLVAAIGRHQPHLKSLKLYTDRIWLYSDARPSYLVDYTPMSGLKELTFVGDGNDKRPINCFVNLPSGLQTLRFHGPIDLSEVVVGLTNVSRHANVRCPACVEISVDYRAGHMIPFGYEQIEFARPFTEDVAVIYENYLRGVGRFITNVPGVQELLLTLRGRNSEIRLRATKNDPQCFPKTHVIQQEFHLTELASFDVWSKRHRRDPDRRSLNRISLVVQRGLTSTWD